MRRQRLGIVLLALGVVVVAVAAPLAEGPTILACLLAVLGAVLVDD